MIEKDPQNYTLITYLWVFIWSLWGGLVATLQKIRYGQWRNGGWKRILFMGFKEVSACTLMGVITFWLCESVNSPGVLTAAFIAMSGHFGTRGLFLLEKLWAEGLKATLKAKFKFPL